MRKFLPLALTSVAAATLFAGTQLVAQTAPEPAAMTRADAETRAAQAFERLDVNKDGQLTQADREAQARLRFDETDADGNGQLSFAEVTAARENRNELREQRRSERGERAEMRGSGMRGMIGKGGRMLEQADANSDGAISREEFTSGALARFDRADANSDGTITADERRGGRGEPGHRRWQRG